MRAIANRPARAAWYPSGPLLRATSRETVDTARPTSAAIAVNVLRWANPREIDSRSSKDNRNRGRGFVTLGRTPPDCANQ